MAKLEKSATQAAQRVKTAAKKAKGKAKTLATQVAKKKVVKRANALQKILRAAYSFITSQDDLIGNAVEDVVTGEVHTGFNWTVKGENNVTNGWLKLQMR